MATASSKNSSTTAKTLPKIKPDTIRVSISKIVQAERFEPVTVQVEQSYTVKADDNVREVFEALYESTSLQVRKMMKAELVKWKVEHAKWKAENGDDD